MSKQIEKIKELIAKREQARLGGGEKAIEKQHARGKYTARERIDMLVDEGSFEEYDMFKLHRCHNFGMEKKQYLGDGVVAGSATTRQLLMDDWCMYMHKTSPLMVVRSLKRCRRKSVRLWIWP